MKNRKIRYRKVHGYFFKKAACGFEGYLRWKSVYDYDRTGRMVKNRFYWRASPQGSFKLSALRHYVYDTRNLLCEIHCFTGRGKLMQKVNFEYNGRRCKIREENLVFGLGGDIIEKIVISMVYDKNDNIVREETVSMSQGHECAEYYYDKLNMLKRKKVTECKESNCYTAVYKYRRADTIIEYDSGARSVESMDGRKTYRMYAPGGNLVELREKSFDMTGKEVCTKTTHFHCDCRGVREEPIEMLKTVYGYF